MSKTEEVQQQLANMPIANVLDQLIGIILEEKVNSLLNPFFKDISEISKKVTVSNSKLGSIIAKNLILDRFLQQVTSSVEIQKEKNFGDAMKLQFSN